jgi:quercetin dioxygenase-like cupin family protein
MPIIHSDDAPSFDIPGVRFIGLAAPSRGARETAVWRVKIDPSAKPLPHRVTREEVFVAISGAARFTIGEEVFDVAAGGAVIVPADTDFALSCLSAGPFEAVVALPVGGQAKLADGQPFTPPWAE